MKSVFFSVFALILFIPSCQKDKKDKIYVLTEKEKLLTSHGWHISSIKINNVEIPLTPWTVDDCWVFREDGTTTYHYGTLISNSHETDWTGTWEFSDDEKTLIYASTSPGIDITSSEMVLTDIYNGDTRVYTYTGC